MKNEEKPEFSEEQIEAAEKQIFEHSKRIEFYITEYTIEILAKKMNDGDFEVPSYQREYTWEHRRKSRFIESVLMGLPIPFLFFWENPETGILEIVDGSQRLRTIQEFISGNLELGELKKLSESSGFRFSDFSESRQRKVKNRSIRGIVLNEHTDEKSRFDLFERINTGSKVAEKAEVRRGALSGAFQNLVISLSEEDYFIQLAPVSEKRRKEREREELVTRFFAYGDGLEEYKDNVSPFLFNYTQKMNVKFAENPELEDNYRQRFMDTMSFVSRTFPWGFRRTPKGKASPRSRFESIAIGSYLALKEKPEITQKSISVEDWHNSVEYKKVIGADGANAKNRLIGRINFVRDRLLED
ncbi:MAG: DUF262 domain-containing protein [Xenococcus sp. (in: cyanobacteria)]